MMLSFLLFACLALICSGQTPDNLTASTNDATAASNVATTASNVAQPDDPATKMCRDALPGFVNMQGTKISNTSCSVSCGGYNQTMDSEVGLITSIPDREGMPCGDNMTRVCFQQGCYDPSDIQLCKDNQKSPVSSMEMRACYIMCGGDNNPVMATQVARPSTTKCTSYEFGGYSTGFCDGNGTCVGTERHSYFDSDDSNDSDDSEDFGDLFPGKK